MLNVPVVMLVAAAAVLAGVVYVATGRGGELAFFQADYAPVKMDQVTSTDVALFRPPSVLWGYSMQATDEALSRIAHAITERDVEISALQQQVADLEAAAGRRRGYTGPEKSPQGVEPPGRRQEPPGRRQERSSRPPGPGLAGAVEDDPDIVLPDRVMQPSEPRRAGRAERDVPPPGDPLEREERDGRDGRDVWRPASRAGQPEREPGDSAAPPTMPWLRRAPSRDVSSTEWAALPKRSEPPSGPAGDGGRDGR